MAVGAAVARPARKAAPRKQPRAAPRRAERRSKGVAGGVVWIVFVTGLLAGVVALNVAVLRLNVQLDGLKPYRPAEHGRERNRKNGKEEADAPVCQARAHRVFFSSVT